MSFERATGDIELSGTRERPAGERSRYRRFWQDTGDHFPDLSGAASTAHYLADEQWLLQRYLPRLDGARLLKTDLWDEAKNTRILQWAAARGARTYGIDISPPIVRSAAAGFRQRGLALHGVIADVRALPFTGGSFDAIYSMGTIEHFAESEEAVAELYRVLRPDGRALVGVPNRRDPFLRPLLVALLYRIGLYGYGYEKSYSRAGLRRMLEEAGFRVTGESGILFLPGWLRMLDLACHSWLRPLARVSGWAVAPFTWLSRRFPALRRHGYLIASVGVKPDDRESAR